MGMATSTKTSKKIKAVKVGEMTASGELRRPKTVKANPTADQSTWRTKLRTSMLAFDDPAKEIFLDEFAKHGRRKHAADAAGVSLHTVREHIKNDPEFSKAYDNAVDAYRDQFVEHAIGDLATNGVAVMAATKDGDVYEARRDYPIRLIELELKRIDPAYREKQELDITSGGGVLVVPAAMTPAEWVADQVRKNAERMSPMEKDAVNKAAESNESVTENPKEVTLLDRAALVAARNAKKVTH